jgi:hypothetical protein
VIQPALLHLCYFKQNEVSNQIRDDILILVILLITEATQLVIQPNPELL